MKLRPNVPVRGGPGPKTASPVNRLAKRTGWTINPYAAIAHLLGCARGGPKDLSERTGEKLRKLVLARTRE